MLSLVAKTAQTGFGPDRVDQDKRTIWGPLMLKLWPLANIGLEWSLKSFLVAPLDGRWLVGPPFGLKKSQTGIVLLIQPRARARSTDAMPHQHQRASLLGRWVISWTLAARRSAEGQTDGLPF